MTDLTEHLKGKRIESVGFRADGDVILRDKRQQIICVLRRPDLHVFDADGNLFEGANFADVITADRGATDGTPEAETIDDQVKEQCELAIVYVEDGAFASAARVLRNIAQKLQTRAEEIAAEIEKERN